MNRFKNYALWSSLMVGLVPLLAQAFGWNLPGNYDELINALLGVLVTAGLLSNPSMGSGFIDGGAKDDEQP